MGTGALVLGSDYKALGLVRSLGRRGIPVWVLPDEHALATHSRYCQRTVHLPSATIEADRVRYLDDLGRRHALDGWALFPTDDETAAFLSRNRGALARYCVTVARWGILRWAYDKRLTYRLACGLGLDLPFTSYPANVQEARAFRGAYPAILKPAIRADANSFTTAKAWRVDDADELAKRYDEACSLVDPRLIMIQELIPGGGEAQLSYAAVCKNGAPIASLVARRVRQWPMDFGRASTYVESIDAPDVEAAAERLLAVLQFDGVVEVEFKRDKRDGRLKLLDVNPRVWGWHTLGRAAGVDFPYLLWRLLHGEAVSRLRGLTGGRWVRGLTDVPTAFGEMRAGRLAPWTYLASLRGPIEYAVLAVDDLAPAILELPDALALSWRRRRVATRQPAWA